MSEKLKVYLMRADSLGQLYQGYIVKVENSVGFKQGHKKNRIEVCSLKDDIVVLGEAKAVIMGRTLNRAVYDEEGNFVTILAGNLIAVRYRENTFLSIQEEDILVIEKMLKPIERIFGGNIYLKDTQKLKIREQKEKILTIDKSRWIL